MEPRPTSSSCSSLSSSSSSSPSTTASAQDIGTGFPTEDELQVVEEEEEEETEEEEQPPSYGEEQAERELLSVRSEMAGLRAQVGVLDEEVRGFGRRVVEVNLRIERMSEMLSSALRLLQQQKYRTSKPARSKGETSNVSSTSSTTPSLKEKEVSSGAPSPSLERRKGERGPFVLPEAPAGKRGTTSEARRRGRVEPEEAELEEEGEASSSSFSPSTSSSASASPFSPSSKRKKKQRVGAAGSSSLVASLPLENVSGLIQTTSSGASEARTPTASPSLSSMPEELLAAIISLLDLRTLCALSQVSSLFRRLADTSISWRRIYETSIGPSQAIIASAKSPPSNPLFDGRVQHHVRGPDYWKDHVIRARKIARRWAEGGTQHTLYGHLHSVQFLQFEDEVLLSCDENMLKEWDLKSLSVVDSFTSNAPMVHFRFNSITVSTYDIREKLVITNKEATRVYDMVSKQFCFSLTDSKSELFRVALDSTRWILTGCWDGFLSTWDSNTGQRVQTIPAHKYPVYCLDFSSHLLTSGSSDKKIHVFDRHTGKLIQALRGHAMTVYSLVLNEATRTIVSGSKDSSIRLWDLRQAKCIAVLNGHSDAVNCVRFDATRIVSASSDALIKVWDLRTGKWLYGLPGHTGPVHDLQFDESVIVSGGADRTIKVWSFA
ncbi:Utp13 domain-containing protein [Balamuthia mandrillaris]